MPPRKVIHLTSAHPTFDVRIFRKQCRTLAAAGYDVVLVSQGDHDQTVDGVRIRAVPRAGNRLQRMTRTAYQVIRAAGAEKADIYHLHDPELLLWSLPLRLRGARIVYDMHEDLPKQTLTKIWLPRWSRGILSRLLGGIERVLLVGVPVVFAEACYQWDRPWVRPSASVLNLPLTDELLAIAEPKHPLFTACYLGTVTPNRGALTMLDAVEELTRRGRQFGFECIGPIPPECRAEVTERAERASSVGSRVHMPGERVLAPEAWRRVAQCHVGLVVLRPIPNNYSIQPTKLFEYMALGMPLIASNFPEYRAVIEESGCGLCVDPDSAGELADAIEWLLDHPDEAAAMGERGREAVRRTFSWSRAADNLLRFYDDLIPPARPGPVGQRAEV